MKLRESVLAKLDGGSFDVLIVGGGINGAVSAASLAARGVRVALVDRRDFASETSQESSNLAWGGIKYLESFELALVRKLCVSRNHLIRAYPSTVREIRFLTVHERGFRHGLFKLFLGTLFYWLLGSFFTKAPRRFSRAALERVEPVLDTSLADGGFEYSDAFLHDNDARFVWGFVRAALDHGCAAANYVECVGAERTASGFRVALEDRATGRALSLDARVLVNAGGPWVDELNQRLAQPTAHRHVFSKGIHLLVPRVTEHHRVLTFFADDGRLFFAIPMGRRTCIGTTDTRVDDPRAEVTPEDRRFVLDNINKRLRLREPLTERDVVAERCGVRPLVVSKVNERGGRDWFELSRKHVVELDRERGVLSIFGGKLTDCLNVGDEVARAVASLGVELPHPRVRWYGEPPATARHDFFHKATLLGLDALTPAHAQEPLSSRLWRRYGSHAFAMLDAIREDPRMGEVLIEGAEYLRCEIEHAARREMVVKLEDFLRRRSKIALVVSQAELAEADGLLEACRIFFGDRAEERLSEYFAERGAGAGVAPPRLDAPPAPAA